MRRFIIPVLTLILFPLLSSGQWLTTGNTTTPGDFLGTLTPQPLVFSTDLNERMRLTPAGSLGINTTNPLSMFHMSQGAFLLDGNLGVNPNPPAGIQFLWVPSQGSLRVGSETLNEWDAPNVGLDTYAFGSGITLNGFSSFSAGTTNSSNSGWGVILGTGNTVLGANNAHVIGQNNTVSNGSHGYVLGRGCTSSGGQSRF